MSAGFLPAKQCTAGLGVRELTDAAPQERTMKSLQTIEQEIAKAPVAADTSLAQRPSNQPGLRPTGRPRVVVVGAGFGGLHVANKLARADVDVLVLDRNNYHGFWP